MLLSQCKNLAFSADTPGRVQSEPQCCAGSLPKLCPWLLAYLHRMWLQPSTFSTMWLHPGHCFHPSCWL